MHIYVDADACPVIRIVENIAKKYNIETTLICDTNHVLTSDYSDVVTVSAGADAVDFKLVNLCTRDDIVVTQDYGVAAMALSKPHQMFRLPQPQLSPRSPSSASEFPF